MSGYRETSEFKKNISFLESKLSVVIDKISLTNEIKSDLQYDTNDSRFIKDNDYTVFWTGKKSLIIDNAHFFASNSGKLDHSSNNISINYHRFSTDIIYTSIKAIEYKNNSFFKFIQSLPNGKDFFTYLNHFLSFSKKFFNNIEFSINAIVNDNIEITSIDIHFLQSIDNLTNLIQESSVQKYSVVLYDSALWEAYNMDKIEDMFNLMELSFCFELFEDFSDIMGNPEGDDMLTNFSEHKESYIALAEINAV